MCQNSQREICLNFIDFSFAGEPKLYHLVINDQGTFCFYREGITELLSNSLSLFPFSAQHESELKHIVTFVFCSYKPIHSKFNDSLSLFPFPPRINLHSNVLGPQNVHWGVDIPICFDHLRRVFLIFAYLYLFVVRLYL